MIPTPRPGPRFGDCPDCGRQHDGECHLAEMDRNRENTETPILTILSTEMQHRRMDG